MKILLYYYFWSLNLIGLAAYSSSTELSGMKQLTEFYFYLKLDHIAMAIKHSAKYCFNN